MSVKIIYDGSVTTWLMRDLARLKVYGRFSYKQIEHTYREVDGKNTLVGVTPPGMYLTEPKSGAGFPYMCQFPPPIHVMEILAAMHGYGGMATEDFPSGEGLERLQRIRKGTWMERIAEMGEWLYLTPAQSRIVTHLLTPLTGYDRDRKIYSYPTKESQQEIDLRAKLYQSLIGGAFPLSRFALAAWSDVTYNSVRPHYDLLADLFPGDDPCHYHEVRV